MSSLFQQTRPIAESYNDESDLILYRGSVNDYVATIPDETVQLIVTSPPYNIGKDYEEQVSIDEYLSGQKQTIQELVRILHPAGSVCWQVGNYVEKGEVFPLDIYYYSIFKELGLSLPIPSPTV